MTRFIYAFSDFVPLIQQFVYKAIGQKTSYFLPLILLFFLTNVQHLNAQCEFDISEHNIADLPIVTVYVNFHFEPDAQNQTFPNDPSGVVGSAQFIASKIVENFNSSMQNVPQNIFSGPNGMPADPLPNNEGRLRMVFYPSFEEALHFYDLNDPSDNSYESVYGDKVLDIRILDENPQGPCDSFFGSSPFFQLK